jgi:ABC-type nitrate/sulfonate/bicarbonate transport system permease component
VPAPVGLTRDEQIATVFLVYLVLPLLAFLVYWIVGLVRRRILKKGGGDEAAQEGEA